MHAQLAGWPCVGCSESLLDIIFRNAKDAAKRIWQTLNQKGDPL